MPRKFFAASLLVVSVLLMTNAFAQSSAQADVNLTVGPYVNIHFEDSIFNCTKDFWAICGTLKNGTFTASRDFIAHANLPATITAQLVAYKPKPKYWTWDIDVSQQGQQHTIAYGGGVLFGTAQVTAQYPGGGPVLALMIITIAPQ
ncbi:MAG TPA: hypothetical protein VNK96_02775 [Fimbriimonadales bacterium]|nr:hypothetical protein [Fimbriimonadales bacterium]